MTAVRLEAAAIHIDRATDQLMAGFAHSGRIAWQPEHSPFAEALTDRATQLDPDMAPTSAATERPASPER